MNVIVKRYTLKKRHGMKVNLVKYREYVWCGDDFFI